MAKIQVKRKSDGEFECLLRHSISKDGKKIRWQCKESEFEIVFDGANPFNSDVNAKFKSENKKIVVEAKGHEGPIEYEYDVRAPKATEGLCPGMIVEP